MTDVLTMGECMAALRAPAPVELLPPLSLSCAGAEATVAIGLSRLGHRAAFVGRVGADGWGRAVRRTLQAEGVDLHLEVGPQPTGLITFTRRGALLDVEYRRAGSAGAALTTAQVDAALDALESVRWGHMTGITPALGPAALAAWHHLLDRLVAADVPVCMDVNHRSKLWDADTARAVLAPVAAKAHTVMGDDDELALLVQADCTDPVATLLAAGVVVVVRKLGADGVEVATASGRVPVAVVPIAVVDPVGAGDAFAAGYLSGILDGLDPAVAADRGCQVAAHVIASQGDWEHLPDRDQLAATAGVRR